MCDAAGLNFRDMMWAMGLLPEEALIDGFAGPTFGLECAGMVRAVGDGVADLAIGDRVAGFAPAALSTQVTTAAHAVTPIPAETSFAAAATDAGRLRHRVYALGTLAKLEAGEHVLIHAAAGGVGLAAIQYAKYRGARRLSPPPAPRSKRAFLRARRRRPCARLARSWLCRRGRRDHRRAGVDVVLNSLSGEAMEQSLGALKPFGRFLELGKRDFYLNRRIHLRPLRQNISYFAIDVDQLPIQRPDLARVAAGARSPRAWRSGAIPAAGAPHFPFAAIDEAFRLMQACGHIGKLVLVPAANAGVAAAAARPSWQLRRDGTYLVTGGIAGFGFAAARWLAEHGAGAVALLGRRGADTPGAAERRRRAARRSARRSASTPAMSPIPLSLGQVLDGIRRTSRRCAASCMPPRHRRRRWPTELDDAPVAAILRPKLGGAVASTA